MARLLARLHADTRGATAVEYGLILTLLSLSLLIAWTMTGNALSSKLFVVSNGLSG